MTMTMETGVTHSTINKKSPKLGLFSSINKYNRNFCNKTFNQSAK